MGLIGAIFTTLFGGGRNVIRETAEVFRPNSEAQARRGHEYDSASLAQMAAEFQYRGERGWFDRFMDGVNRLPRPLMVFGCFGLLVYTPIDPVRMAEVFAAWALIPAGMWAIMGAIVTFFFGGRDQIKTHDFQKELAETMTRVPGVVQNMETIRALNNAESSDLGEPDDNPALEAMKK